MFGRVVRAQELDVDGWLRASPGLASSRNVSKNAPVAPSAKNQDVAGAATPLATDPAANSSPGALRYIARSATMGRSLLIVVPNSAAAIGPPSWLTHTVWRERGPMDRTALLGRPVGEQVLDRHRGRGRMRVLQKEERLEAGDGGALGEVPRRARRRDAIARVTAVRCRSIPCHASLGDDLCVTLDDDAELAKREADVARVEMGCAHGWQHHRMGDVLTERSEELDVDRGRAVRGVEERKAGGKEVTLRAFGEMPDTRAPRMSACGELGGVGAVRHHRHPAMRRQAMTD